MIPFGIMVSKIYSRRVMKIGHEPRHSFMVTIPRNICNVLQIEKGTRLYFKLEENRFVVSKDIKFLDSITESSNDDTVTVKSANEITKEKERNDIILDRISLADLQY
jgi:bifunctional DNA-binding transcriptional regulator/antitoxin component of YhaV-PrlF toxin-antitoxin module